MSTTAITRFQRAFVQELGSPWDVLQLFDFLPDTYFYAKKLDGTFVVVSRAVATMFGAAEPADLVGKKDRDVSPGDLADQYAADDRRVIESRKVSASQPWLIPDHHGTRKWYLVTKMPLVDKAGKVCGLAGVMRGVDGASDFPHPYGDMDVIVQHLLQHYAERIDFRELAQLASLSISQLDRRFKRLFQLTPQKFLLGVRLSAACRILASTDYQISEVAYRTGFYDQSHFTKLFRREKGMTPKEHRRRYRRIAPPTPDQTAAAPPPAE